MISNASKDFPDWVFDTAFPFSFAWDSTQRITRCGRSLKRFLPESFVGVAVTELFRLTRPAGRLDAAWINAHRDILMLIEVIGTGIALRGQVMAAAPNGPWLFAGSPWLKSPDQLNSLGLSMGDFAPHDSTVDMLYVVQSQRVGNRELSELNDRLNVQGKLLAEKEQQARKLAMVAEKTSGAVIITDATGRIEWVNDAFVSMTGWSLEESRGRKPGAFLQGKYSDPAKVVYMRSQIAKGAGFAVEILNYRKCGSPYWNNMEVQPIADVAGKVSHFIALGADVTERKLKELHRRIETVIAEAITAGAGTGSIITLCLGRLAQTLEATEGRWWQAETHGQKLNLVETWSVPAKGTIPRGKSSFLALLERYAGSSLWNSDASAVEAELDTLASNLAIPVAVGKRFFGVLEFSLDFVIPPDVETLAALTRLGSQIGLLLKRLEAEEAYKEAERIAHLGNWSMHVATGRIQWSDEKFRIYGYQPSEVDVDMDFCLRAIHPDDVDRVGEALRLSIATGSTMKVIYRIRRPSGQIRHLKCNAEALVDSDGATVALIGTVMDITELEQVRSALRETEERWQLALESMSLGVWDWDLEAGTIIYTDTLLAMLGYQNGDWENDPDSWTSRVHPDDRAAVRAAIALCLSGESREYVTEHRILCKNGTWKWVQHVGRVVALSQQDKPLRMVGTQMDIQIRKGAEQASGKRTELLNRIRAAQGNFIAIEGLESVCTEMIGIALSYTESAFGFILQTPDEGAAEPSLNCFGIPHDFLHDETDSMVDMADASGSQFLTHKSLFTSALGSGEVVIALARAPGSRAVASPHGYPCVESFLGLPVLNGLETVGMIGLANRTGGYDPELIKELDPFVAAVGSMIVADRVESRRRKAEEELRAARDRAEAANRAKGDFLAMMSHEIRTPMNGVLGMAGLLRESALSRPQHEMINTVIQSGEALVRIIDDILDFSKVEAGLICVKQEYISVDELLDGVIDLLAQEATYKGLELVTIIHHDVPDGFQGDLGRIRQILLNLAGNAVKFTERGYVAIRVAPAPEGLVFSVVDSGIGIAPGYREMIFQPFRQIDSSASRQAGGTGLGLAICKKLVDKMGGRIGVNGMEPGSEFWFRIPIPTTSALPKQPARQTWPQPDSRIWIADQMPLTREAILMAMGGAKEKSLEIPEYCELIDLLTADIPTPDILFIEGKWFTPRIQALIGEKRNAYGALEPRIVLTRRDTGEDGDGLPCLKHPLRRRSIREAALPRDEPPLTHPSADTEQQPLGLKVLIAEDNPVNATLMKLYLEKIGCEWILATDGSEALEKFEQNHFDAILMDCQMPSMDGYEATKRIRTLESERGELASGVNIIAVTANALEGERIRCLKSGMNDYISKPFDAQSLAKILLKHNLSAK